MLIVQLIGQLVGVALGAFLGAIIVQWATRWAAGFKPPYWQAYRAAFFGYALAFVAQFILGFIVGASGQKFDASTIVLLAVTSFFVQAVVYGIVLKDSSGQPLGTGRALLVSFVQLIIGIGIILLIVAFFWALYTFAGTAGQQRESGSTAPATYQAPSNATPKPSAPPAVRSFSSVDEAKQEAVRLYPSLGIAGSQFNSAFLARYREYQRNRPNYFNDNSWPVRLAEEIARAGYQ